MNQKTPRITGPVPLFAASLAIAFLAAACVTVTPSPQLLETRQSFAVAREGETAKLSPAALYDAEKALARANMEFSERGNSQASLDYTYIAQRKLELADAKARTEADRVRIAEAARMGLAARDSQIKAGQSALSDSREQLRSERNANDAATSELRANNEAQGKALEKSETELAEERVARQDVESRLTHALKDLAGFAEVKEDPRGLVITLSGSVLFASGQATLLTSAQARLDQVAEALKAQADDKSMVVEGHTDSRGSDAINQPLARNRAIAVRDYLVSRGVDAKKIMAVGMGSSQPLLDNKSAENRANNRRVEIVIHTTAISAR